MRKRLLLDVVRLLAWNHQLPQTLYQSVNNDNDSDNDDDSDSDRDSDRDRDNDNGNGNDRQ